MGIVYKIDEGIERDYKYACRNADPDLIYKAQLLGCKQISFRYKFLSILSVLISVISSFYFDVSFLSPGNALAHIIALSMIIFTFWTLSEIK